MIFHRIAGLMAAGVTALLAMWAGSAVLASDEGIGGAYAASGPAGLLKNLFPSVDNRFTGVSVALRNDWNADKAAASNDLAVLHVSGNGNEGFKVTILDRTDGQQRSVHFPADSFVPDDDDEGGKYEVKVVEGLKSFRFRLSGRENDFDDHQEGGSPYDTPSRKYATVFEIEERNSGLKALFAFGARTPAGGRPNAGIAVYRGWLQIEAPAADHSDYYNYGGNISLKADFSDGSVTGTVQNMNSNSESGGWVSSDMPNGNRIDISNGKIAGGQLTAEWKGHGPEDAPARTMLGFTGTMTAVFHGPAAEELAGVVEGRREADAARAGAPAQVAIGRFVAERGDGRFETARDFIGPEAAPAYASAGEGGLLSNLFPSGENRFTGVSVALREDGNEDKAAAANDVAVVHVSGDGNEGFKITILDRTDGQQRSVHFPADSFVPDDDDEGGKYEVKVVEGLKSFRFRLSGRENDFDDHQEGGSSYDTPWHKYATVFEIEERNSGLKALFAFGARTPAGGLPYSGTAEYRGWMSINATSADLSDLHYYGGQLRLEADFADGSVSGRVEDMEAESRRRANSPGGRWDPSRMPRGNRIDISDGKIVGARLTAEWIGHGPAGMALTTVRGFSGTLTAVFHGPAAEELAGVLEGSREAAGSAPAQVAVGEFVAKRGDVSPGPVRPLGELLPSGNHVFPAVSTGLVQDSDEEGGGVLTDGVVVQQVSSDGKGGFNVTIISKEHAVQRVIHFPAESFVPFEDRDGGQYEADFSEGIVPYQFRLYSKKGDFDDDEKTDGSPWHAYATVFELEEWKSGWRSRFSFGPRTPAGMLPSAGTALYRGELNMRTPAPDRSERYGYKGDLRLTADFADSSVSGTVDEMESRISSGSFADMPDDNRIDISNGKIVGGRLTAEWKGHGPAGTALTTMSGFTGNLWGAFHGAAGEEVAGVIDGSRTATGGAPAQVAIGHFMAERGDGVFTFVNDAEANEISPVYAYAGSEPLEDQSGIELGGASISLLRDLRNLNDRVMKPVAGSAEIRSVRLDGDRNYTVNYVVDGEDHSIPFRRNEDGRYDTVTEDGVEFRFWNTTTDGKYWDVVWAGVQRHHCEDCFFGNYALIGLETRPEVLRSLGSANYEGGFWASLYPEDRAKSRNWRDLRGDLDIQADFSEGRISGEVDGIEMRDSQVENSNRDWSDLADSNSIAILDGRINDSRFTASWAGRDSDAESDSDRSLRGFAGGIKGAFYGPAGEEIGGIFGGGRAADGASPAWKVAGNLGGNRVTDE